jgi:ABC-2 type transport system ATP-binding protein
VGEFSKGMMRRVGLAAALVNDPDLVILDEPTSGLDPLGCRQIKDLIRTLASRGKTILLTSHLLADVEDVCDRMAILYGGRVQAEGSIRDLLRVQDRVDLRLPEIDEPRLREILEFIRARTGSDPEVRHPSMNLEAFFLRVVEQARAAGQEASGAGGQRAVADYLSTGPAAESPTTPAPSTREEIEQRLRRLTGDKEG